MQLGCFYDCIRGEGELMATDTALVAFVTPAIDELILLPITTRATKTIKPPHKIWRGLAFFFGFVELHEMRQG